MSLPHPARSDDMVPTEPRARVCPQCRTRWASGAPETCPKDGTALVDERSLDAGGADPMVGRTLEGRYTILTKLGAGSMGTVYRARQHAMGREVAIKILRGDRAADEASRARFMREARANSLLASPNTVTVFDFGESETGEFYLAMELLEGESVGQRLTREGKLSAPVAVDAARQALRSLAEAHAKGIIHRDLKPDNLFFTRVFGASTDKHDEIVKVLDFGIAKMLRSDDAPMGVVETQAGTVFGTPRYMSPEQAQGKPLDARTDLYSLAVILYQMLAGRPPFLDTDAVVVMARHIKSTPKRPNEANPEANVPKELEDVLMRCLAKDPAERPASAEIMAGELLAALEAQGAMTSGVRASITNAAGIRVPESMRPPPILLPTPAAPRRKLPPMPAMIAGGAAVVVLAALLVYLALGGRNVPAEGAAGPAASASGRASSGVAEAPAPPEPASSGISASDLPSAPTVAAGGTARPATAPKGSPRPPRAGAGKGKPAGGAPPGPSASSSYGIFE